MELSEYMGEKRQLFFTEESQILNIEGVREIEDHPRSHTVQIAVGKMY